jgi:hypothetical protein
LTEIEVIIRSYNNNNNNEGVSRTYKFLTDSGQKVYTHCGGNKILKPVEMDAKSNLRF